MSQERWLHSSPADPNPPLLRFFLPISTTRSGSSIPAVRRRRSSATADVAIFLRWCCQQDAHDQNKIGFAGFSCKFAIFSITAIDTTPDAVAKLTHMN